MELNEAIRHERQEAENYTITSNALYEKYYKISLNCQELADYHERLADWLTELQERREADRWISVTEKLPEKDGIYLVTFFTGLFNTRLCTTTSYYLKCGWSMENVIYWKPLPKPYESEDK